MALTKCSECGHEISTAASVCPHCGNPNKATVAATPAPPPAVTSPAAPQPAGPVKKSSKKWWLIGGCGCLTLLAIIAVALFTGIIGGLSFLAKFVPEAKIHNFTTTADAQLINGEMDAGYMLACDVENLWDDPQDVIVEMELSCSEGQWTERRTVHLKGKETQHVTHFFAQPTINATNVRSQVKVVKDAK